MLTACQSLQLPSHKLMSLYEQVRVRVCPRGSSRAHARSRTRTHVRARAHIRARGHQIILELLELREVDVARAMLRQTECMLTMKQEQPERHMRLEALASRPIWCVRACHVWSVSGDGRGGGTHARRAMPGQLQKP